MIRLLLAVLCFASLAVPSKAGSFDDFKTTVDTQFGIAAEAFAKDVGGLIGASDFHSARVPGLGGFDIGVSANIQNKPASDNTILALAGVDAFGVPLIRAEAGLPFGLGVFLRGVGVGDLKLVGGGVRYQIYKSGLVLAIPDVAVTVGLDKLTHDDFELKHVGASAQASWNIPILKPFVGVGLDSTTLEVKTGTQTGKEKNGKGSRLSIGASITPFPFAYIFGAYNINHGEPGVSAGLGIRFGGIL